MTGVDARGVYNVRPNGNIAFKHFVCTDHTQLISRERSSGAKEDTQGVSECSKTSLTDLERTDMAKFDQAYSTSNISLCDIIHTKVFLLGRLLPANGITLSLRNHAKVVQKNIIVV